MQYTVARDSYEARENETLAPWAMRSSASRGRRHDEAPDRWRTAFQRDRDRIVHSTAFRRLESKTQVFVSRTGDHFRTRLTHSLEVAQIGRSIARILALNEDLVEAVALAHDLGHTPFGHSGGEVLDELMREWGGFEHNFQSLRIVDRLEVRYPGFSGLNLTYEVRESILKHARPFDHPIYDEYHREESPLLEAQLVDVCDGIAYLSHDLDDGLRSGILTPAMVSDLALWRTVDERVRRKWPGIEGRLRLVKCVSEVIDFFINDLLTETALRLESRDIRDVAGVRATSEPLVGFSPDVLRMEHELRGFLYEEFYTHFEVHRMRNRARILIEGLFREFTRNPRLLPPRFQALAEEQGLQRTVADYIAGMTDSYAQEEYERLFNPFEGR